MATEILNAKEKRMKTLHRIAITALMAAMDCAAFAQDQTKVGTAASSKLAPLPVFPQCATASAQRGDPSKGAAVFLVKMTGNCVVPWHWHTAGENLMIVSGKAKVEMKDGGTSSPVAAGDYVFMPGKHVHQFTCVAACTFFVSTEGAFDIHYVDKDGKEIPLEKALPPAK